MRYNLLAMKSRVKMPLVLIAMLFLGLPAVATGLAGCGTSPGPGETAQRFVDVCNNRDAASLLAMLSASYREQQSVPESLTSAQLEQALKPYTRLTMDTGQNASLESDRAVMILSADTGENTSTSGQTLVLTKTEGTWKVDGCTALNWASVVSRNEGGTSADRAAVETQLKNFLNACIDGNTNYLFNNLSAEFLADHSLTKPWTSAQFSGIFGTARSYDFSPQAIEFPGADKAQAKVSVEFGTRGNLQSESADVTLVREKGTWKVDAFPFFIF